MSDRTDFIKGTIFANETYHTLSVPYGTTALEAIRLSDISIYSPCGGNGTCGKCRTKVTGNLSVPDDKEKSFLSEEEMKKGIRLACMCRLYGDFEIDIRFGNLRVQTDFNGISYTFSPMIKEKKADLTVLP